MDTGDVFSCAALQTDKSATFSDPNAALPPRETPHDAIVRVFSRWQTQNLKKEALFRPFRDLTDADDIRRALKKHKLPQSIVKAVLEAL